MLLADTTKPQSAHRFHISGPDYDVAARRRRLGLGPKQETLNIVHVNAMERMSADRTETVGSITEIDDHRTHDRSIGLDDLEAAVAGSNENLHSAVHANPDVHLGVALTVRLDEAIENLQGVASHYEKMIALRPDDAAARNHLTGILMVLRRAKEASAQYRAAIVANPDRAETYFNLGNIFDAIGRPAEAVVAYRQALAIRADFAAAHNKLGNIFQKLDQLAEAEAHYRRAIEIAPNDPHPYSNLGNVFAALNRHKEAILAYERAIALGSTDAKIYNSVGIAHNVLGQAEDAYRAFQRAVVIEPRNAAMHFSLATCKPFTDGDERLIALEKLSEDAKLLPENDQVALHFALGKAFDDLKQPQRSFHHLSAGNKLKRSQIAYDEVESLRLFQRIQATFTPDLLAKNAGVGDPSSLPIFVIGMPRSGTTLIEQILASHPKVFGAGEILDLRRVIADLPGASGARFPEVMTEMTGEALRRAGSSYLDRISSPAGNKERIVNKMPTNFLFIGLIYLALPNARVIHVRRDPLDTCFSCYSQMFRTQPFAYDLAELGRFYRAYEGLMDHWRKVLPHDFILDVHYETVVGDLEGEARRLLDYCGLAWDEACLRFYETRRPVLTASFAQVRQPIYRHSIGHWRPYRQMLQPLIEALDFGTIQPRHLQASGRCSPAMGPANS